MAADETFADPARLAALADSGLLDDTPDEALDRLVRLLRDLLDAPVAFLAVAGAETFLFKSVAGACPATVPGREVPVSHTFCQGVIATGGRLVITDARKEAPDSVAATRFRAYAGVPVTGPGGHLLGTLSVADERPRDWTPEDLRILSDLAASVSARAGERMANAALARREQEHTDLLASMTEVVYRVDPDGSWSFLSPAWTHATGFGIEETLGRPLLDFTPPEDRAWLVRELLPLLLREKEALRVRLRLAHRDGGYRTFESVARVLGAEGRFLGAAGTLTDITEREALAAVAAASEEDFRTVCNSTSALIWTLDADGRIVFANRALRELLGIALGADVGRGLDDALHPDDMAEWEEVTAAALVEGRPSSAEVRVYDARGSIRWLSCQVSPRQVPGAARRGWVVTASDGTWERAAREALRAREEHFRALCNSAPAMMWTEDEKGRCTFLNEAWVAFTGVPRAAQLELGWLDRVHPDDRDATVAALDGARVARAPYAAEFRILRHDGEYRWVLDQALPRFGAEGEYLGRVGTCFDITERKLAEQALRERSREVTAVFDHAPVGIQYYSADGTLVRMNRASAEIAGLAPDHGVGRYNVLRQPGVPGGCPPAAARAFDGEVVEIHNWDRTVPGDPDRRQVLDWLFYPLAAPGEPVGGVVAFTRDVTERVQMDRAVQEAQKLESIGLLAGGVAHDFNNILMAILGNVSLAQREAAGVPNLAAFLADIELAARRASDLAGQLLAYSGRGRLYVEPVDFNAVIQEMTSLLRVTIGREVRFRLALTAGLPTIEADATQVRQVVMNLIRNAAEAIGDGPGEIVLRTGVAQGPGRAEVYIEVADTGPGMDEATKARIFDPFFTTRFTGRGLGLAAVLGIVRGHGGQVAVDSSPGAGATFRASFPAPVAGLLPSPARPQPDAGAGNGTVLVVDDEEAVRTLIQRALGRFGVDVLTARDGVEGVELFRKHAGRVSCVLLDLTMPRADGREALRGIRACRADARVVMMSGYSEKELVPQLAEERPDAFLQKPFGLAALRDTLERSLAAPAADAA